MTELELGTLEQVRLSRLWPHEAHHFTPWLSTHLGLLGKEVGLDLELDRPEARITNWGNVDILAKQAESGSPVVIENQYGDSDDSHFLRLLGYATGSEADIVIWVSERFTERYLELLRWLNRGDVIDFYAVEVSGWKIGQSAAPYFRAMVVPERDESSSTRVNAGQGWHTGTAYADFYRPLAERLRREGNINPVSKGGWRGRYRSFRTGYEEQGIVYYLSLDSTTAGQSGAWVGFQTQGNISREVYGGLNALRTQIQSQLAGTEVEWGGFDGDEGIGWFAVSQEARSLAELVNDPGPTRDWMFENLVKLKQAVQPHLERIMGELQPSDAPADDEPLDDDSSSEE